MQDNNCEVQITSDASPSLKLVDHAVTSCITHATRATLNIMQSASFM